jgi:hypothetical protein
MTLNELITKLDECRDACAGSSDDRINDAYWTLNEILSDIDKGRLECTPNF